MKFALALSLVLAGTPHPSTTTATAAQGYEAFSKRELFLAAERFRSKSRIATSRAEEAERDAAELAQALDEASRDVVERGLAVWSEDASQRPVLIVRGQARLLDEEALGDIERVRSLLEDLESKQSVAQLLELARDATSARIFIGFAMVASSCDVLSST